MLCINTLTEINEMYNFTTNETDPKSNYFMSQKKTIFFLSQTAPSLHTAFTFQDYDLVFIFTSFLLIFCLYKNQKVSK